MAGTEKRMQLYNSLIDAGRKGDWDTAFHVAGRILKEEPGNPVALQVYGVGLYRQGQYSEALKWLEKAVSLDELNPWFRFSMAPVYLSLSNIEKAVGSIQSGLRISPDIRMNSMQLLWQNYSPAWSRDEVLMEHKAFAERYGRLIPKEFTHDRNSSHGDKIRIGLVSNDLGRHIGEYFIKPIVDLIDRDEFDIYIYQIPIEDEHGGKTLSSGRFTDWIRSVSDRWRSFMAETCREIAETIFKDRIDILLDLCGHAGSNKIEVFMRRPSPLQVNWLGYPNTTGVREIDYRIVDCVTDPPGESERYCVEKLARFGSCFLPFHPPDDAPDVSPPPSARLGHIVFGSFNRTEKISDDNFLVWVDILRSVENSRLFLKDTRLNSLEIRNLWTERFRSSGIEPDRLMLVGHTADHLLHYQAVDIALDTFPYNGTLTTFDALWMGVPVVTMAGITHAGRVGASILKSACLDELVAGSTDEYSEIARSLASNPERLAALRSVMRQRLLDTVIGRNHHFVEALSEMLRRMWRGWRSGAAADHITVDAPSGRSTAPPAPSGDGAMHLYFGERGTEPRAGWVMANTGEDEFNDFAGMLAVLRRLGDDSVAEIYACHVMEHLSFSTELPVILGEFRRVLMPTGSCRISVPDLDALCRLLLDGGLRPEHKMFIMAHIFGGQANERDIHKIGLNFDILSIFLIHAGFGAIEKVESFELFHDHSTLTRFGVPVSLNVVGRVQVKA